jgi:hypothetical protein
VLQVPLLAVEVRLVRLFLQEPQRRVVERTRRLFAKLRHAPQLVLQLVVILLRLLAVVGPSRASNSTAVWFADVNVIHVSTFSD